MKSDTPSFYGKMQKPKTHARRQRCCMRRRLYLCVAACVGCVTKEHLATTFDCDSDGKTLISVCLTSCETGDDGSDLDAALMPD